MAASLERILAPFSMKGALVKVLEPCIHDREGHIVKEGKHDIMEREFRAFKYKGNKDPNSGAEVQGSEDEFMEAGREARDARLVGMPSGHVAHAVGELGNGGMLYDMNGRPVGAPTQPQVQRTRRSPKDW
jgi:hypothetical protein